MGRFYEPPIEGQFDNPFRRDGEGRLGRPSYWLDMSDRSLALAMTQGIGRDLTVAQKRWGEATIPHDTKDAGASPHLFCPGQFARQKQCRWALRSGGWSSFHPVSAQSRRLALRDHVMADEDQTEVAPTTGEDAPPDHRGGHPYRIRDRGCGRSSSGQGLL